MIKDILQFSIRIITFLGAFYFIVEYIVSSKVSTGLGFLILLLCMIGIAIIFIVFRFNKLKLCDSCGNSHFPSALNF